MQSGANSAQCRAEILSNPKMKGFDKGKVLVMQETLCMKMALLNESYKASNDEDDNSDWYIRPVRAPPDNPFPA